MSAEIRSDAPSHANPSSEELRRLLDRVEAAAGANWQLEVDIQQALEPAGWRAAASPPAYTVSIDAALALVERVLAGDLLVSVGPIRLGGVSSGMAAITKVRPGNPSFSANAPTTPLAMLAALLKAILAEPLQHNARDGASPQIGEPQ